MATRTFKSWIMDDQNLAEEQKNEIDSNIELEKKIIKEQNEKTNIRRSERIARKKQTIEAYDAYILSMQNKN